MRPLFFLAILAWALPLAAADLDDELRDLEDFSRSLSVIESQGLYPRQHSQLIDAAISGMLTDLDPYSRLLDQEGFEQVRKVSQGQSFGVGLGLEPAGEGLRISRVIEGTPAFAAGLKRGMVVLSLDDQPVGGHDFTHLESLRHSKEPLKIQLKSGRRLSLKKVWYQNPGLKWKRPKVGWLVVEIPEFFVDTPKELAAKLKELKPKTLVLDLRDNPGGLVFSAVETAEVLLGPGPIVETKNRKGERMDVFVARRPPVVPLQKILVLLNKNSASAAEILAQALKEREAALLIGERSFGKGVVQNLFPLGPKRYALLTVARYYGPSGESFHERGIEPDLSVEDAPLAERWSQQDLIYQKALSQSAP